MLSDWLEALRYSFRQPTPLAHEIRQNVIIIISNVAIIGLLFQVGAWSSRLVEKWSDILLLSPVLLTNLLGFSTLVLCLPSLIILWRSLRNLVHEATKSIFSSSKALKYTKTPFIAVTFRESIMILVLLALTFPATSWVIRYFSLGWYPALLIPFLLIAALGYLLWDSVSKFQRHVEEAFSTILTGEKTPESARQSKGEDSEQERY